jgi:hypothetical protein
MTESPPKEGPDAAGTPVILREPMRARVAVAVEICCARPTLRRTTRIAAVVGLVLSGINEGDDLVHGHISGATEIKMALNFLVPFVVSNLGVLAGTRRG